MSNLDYSAFETAVREVLEGEITSIAPLGFSGEEITLSGSKGRNDENRFYRCSLVQLRKYCDGAELLITNRTGEFLFYGRFNEQFGVDAIAKWFYDIYLRVKPQIEGSFVKKETSVSKNVKYTPGFAILEAAAIHAIESEAKA